MELGFDKEAKQSQNLNEHMLFPPQVQECFVQRSTLSRTIQIIIFWREKKKLVCDQESRFNLKWSVVW